MSDFILFSPSPVCLTHGVLKKARGNLEVSFPKNKHAPLIKCQTNVLVRAGNFFSESLFFSFSSSMWNNARQITVPCLAWKACLEHQTKVSVVEVEALSDLMHESHDTLLIWFYLLHEANTKMNVSRDTQSCQFIGLITCHVINPTIVSVLDTY